MLKWLWRLLQRYLRRRNMVQFSDSFTARNEHLRYQNKLLNEVNEAYARYKEDKDLEELASVRKP